MSWAVDTPVHVGTVAFAAIVETRVSVHAMDRVVAGDGEKRPLMFLLLDGETARGIDLSGRAHTAEDIERRYPGAIVQMTDMLESPD